MAAAGCHDQYYQKHSDVNHLKPNSGATGWAWVDTTGSPFTSSRFAADLVAMVYLDRKAAGREIGGY